MTGFNRAHRRRSLLRLCHGGRRIAAGQAEVTDLSFPLSGSYASCADGSRTTPARAACKARRAGVSSPPTQLFAVASARPRPLSVVKGSHGQCWECCRCSPVIFRILAAPPASGSPPRSGPPPPAAPPRTARSTTHGRAGRSPSSPGWRAPDAASPRPRPAARDSPARASRGSPRRRAVSSPSARGGCPAGRQSPLAAILCSLLRSGSVVPCTAQKQLGHTHTSPSSGRCSVSTSNGTIVTSMRGPTTRWISTMCPRP